MLDRTLDVEAREDAVRELTNHYYSSAGRPQSWVEGDRVVDALVTLASGGEDGSLDGDAAEVLAIIWLTRGRFGAADRARFDRLTRGAQDEVRSFFEASGRLNWLA